MTGVPVRAPITGGSSTVLESPCPVLLPGGKTEVITYSEAVDRFMQENCPEFKEKESVSFPQEMVDCGLSTQALLYTDEEARNLEAVIKNHRTLITGAEAEIKIFDFLKNQNRNQNKFGIFNSIK